MSHSVTNITATETKRHKAALKTKLRDLLDASRERVDLQIEYVADSLDRVRSSTDRDVAVQRLDQQAHLIHEVESALVKIEKRTYGLCEKCEKPIPRDRLDAVPWAPLCVACQSQVEVVSTHGYGSLVAVA
jgi:DnaK suppressor protein